MGTNDEYKELNQNIKSVRFCSPFSGEGVNFLSPDYVTIFILKALKILQPWWFKKYMFDYYTNKNTINELKNVMDEMYNTDATAMICQEYNLINRTINDRRNFDFPTTWKVQNMTNCKGTPEYSDENIKNEINSYMDTVLSLANKTFIIIGNDVLELDRMRQNEKYINTIMYGKLSDINSMELNNMRELRHVLEHNTLNILRPPSETKFSTLKYEPLLKELKSRTLDYERVESPFNEKILIQFKHIKTGWVLCIYGDGITCSSNSGCRSNHYWEITLEDLLLIISKENPDKEVNVSVFDHSCSIYTGSERGHRRFTRQ